MITLDAQLKESLDQLEKARQNLNKALQEVYLTTNAVTLKLIEDHPKMDWRTALKIEMSFEI